MDDDEISYIRTVSSVADLLQGKWSAEILCAMRHGPIRFGELRRKIPRASKKALTARLRYFESHNVVQRRDLSRSQLHVEYSITEGVRERLTTLLDCLAAWGETQHVAKAESSTNHKPRNEP